MKRRAAERLCTGRTQHQTPGQAAAHLQDIKRRLGYAGRWGFYRCRQCGTYHIERTA